MDRSARSAFWVEFINREKLKSVTEIGVWRGMFAQHILSHCPSIERYYLVDPWRHLDNWNKPLNRSDDVFAQAFAEARERVAPWSEKCTFLRGATVEVDLPQVDFTYIDGDHSLRGITIDLVRAWPRTKWLGGDDFGRIWQHSEDFEPSLVNPAAAHFAEAVGERFEVFGNQFLIGGEGGFDYRGDTRLLPHLQRRRAPLLKRIARRLLRYWEMAGQAPPA